MKILLLSQLKDYSLYFVKAVEEVLNYCKQNLADYKIPKQLVFKEDVPLTPAGKIQKALLREEFQEQKANH